LESYVRRESRNDGVGRWQYIEVDPSSTLKVRFDGFEGNTATLLDVVVRSSRRTIQEFAVGRVLMNHPDAACGTGSSSEIVRPLKFENRDIMHDD
jgi:hypothetical protein